MANKSRMTEKQLKFETKTSDKGEFAYIQRTHGGTFRKTSHRECNK